MVDVIGDHEPLKLEEALEVILGSVSVLPVEVIALRDSLDRVLARDIHASCDLPPFDNSAMDGYAVIAEDTKGASHENPCELTVIASEPAGVVIDNFVSHGSAVRIMTGAPMPAGADAVVMVEETERSGDGVLICGEVACGENARRAGEDVRQGELVLDRGMRIGPAEMAMLAALGEAEVEVYRKPRVAVLTTGNETVDVTQSPGPGQIRDSNQYSLLAQARRAGAEVTVLERVGDNPDDLKSAIRRAVGVSDVIVTSGGVSVGDFDLVKDILASLGDVRFWCVAIKPGKPLAFGYIDGQPFFGLPGNPASVMVAFDVFVRPALVKIAGAQPVWHTLVSGSISQDLRHKAGRREFVRAITVWYGSGYVASTTGNQGAARLSSMLRANSYIVIPEGMGDVKAGERVDILLMH